MPADCKLYYYIGKSENVKENLRFFSVPAKKSFLSAGNVVYNKGEFWEGIKP